MSRKTIKDTDDMLSLQSCWCPPIDDEYKHWDKLAFICMAILAITLISIFTFWNFYD
jgi:hypothetical protein